MTSRLYVLFPFGFFECNFARVYPDITLKTLRSELGGLLGAERRINKFSFLKCVGRSLALVSSAACLLVLSVFDQAHSKDQQ